MEGTNMSSPLQKDKSIKESASKNDYPFNERPKVRLLNDEQWFFVRKRFHLSPRELDVARFVCRGFSNEEIAKLLGIKSATVKTHLRNVYRRTRVKRKLDMLLKFLEQNKHF